MDDLEEVYTDIIMEHSISTKNKYNLIEKDKEEHGHNPSCGDDITLEIKFDGNIIKDLSYAGYGCTISQGSASIMIDLLKGKSKEEAIKLINIFLKMVNGEDVEEAELNMLGDAKYLKSITKMPARIKCATLAWETMRRMIY